MSTHRNIAPKVGGSLCALRKRKQPGNDSLDFDSTPQRRQPDAKSAPEAKLPAKRAKKSNSKTFPFLRLPPELRNRIYELALTDPHEVHIASTKGSYRRLAGRTPYKYNDDGTELMNPHFQRIGPNLFVTCRQV